MIIISTRDFRANQSKFMDMANNGEDIILKSRKNGSFKLVPVSESDMLISKEYILEPDADLDRAITMDELLQGVKNNESNSITRGERIPHGADSDSL